MEIPDEGHLDEDPPGEQDPLADNGKGVTGSAMPGGMSGLYAGQANQGKKHESRDEKGPERGGMQVGGRHAHPGSARIEDEQASGDKGIQGGEQEQDEGEDAAGFHVRKELSPAFHSP